ncbi:MAG: zinc-binding dehydrogenase [Candidatus Sumerlaeia bacterium]
MKAVAVVEKGKVEVVDIPMPRPKEYECLVKVKASGLCNSTDLKIIQDEISTMKVPFPVILGHEGVGEVVEVGSKVKNIKVGDRFLNPSGRLEPETPFERMWGSMKEYSIVQDTAVMDEMGLDPKLKSGPATRQIPREISAEDGGVILCLKENYSAIPNFGFHQGMDVLIFGDGPVGLGLTKFLKMRGAGWVGCVGHHADRLEIIKQKGPADMVINSHETDVADAVGDRQFDLVIDAVGLTSIILQGSKMLKPGGKVGVYGVLKQKDSQISLLDLKNHTSVHILNFPYREHDYHDEIVQLILDGKVDPKDFYSHVMPADDAAKAVDMIGKREAWKIIFTF